MGITNWVRLKAPKASQIDSLAQQKLKALHPKKAAETWFHRSVQRLKKLGVWLTSFRSSLGSKIPGVQLRTRNVVTRNIDNFMTGKGVQAQSRTGVSLEPEDRKFAVEEFAGGATFEGDKLMELDKGALQQVEDEFDEVNKRYTREVVAYDRKQQNGTLTEGDVKQMDELGSEFREARDRFTRTTALAVKLDMSRMNEKLRSATSMQQLLKAQARAMALNPEDFDDSFLVARLNVASFDSAQRDIDRRIVELGETYRRMVYDDVVDFLDAPDGDFAKLVNEQKRHDLIKGTAKLGHSTGDIRLPGLDWYVRRAKAVKAAEVAEADKTKGHLVPEISDMDVLQTAAALMYSDWSAFHGQVQDQIDTIRQDHGEKRGSFNPDDMTTYHHAKSYMATLNWLEELGAKKDGNINKNALYNVTADYGEDLGFGLRIDGAASEASVLAKYGMSSFKSDYLDDKLPNGALKPAVQAHPKNETVTVDRDIVQSQLLGDPGSPLISSEATDSPPYPEDPEEKTDLGQLRQVFTTPNNLTTGQSPDNGADGDLISFDDEKKN